MLSGATEDELFSLSDDICLHHCLCEALCGPHSVEQSVMHSVQGAEG